ncbi:hypothetical protein LCGC14_1683910 [marine sediment metagenome]|uniref:Uncharacterized protein n=1 Tax=marine sediment metagenome TaxID=412755 RepID=A0A0F9HNB9_9ZZZZ|nr:hypothetical protein [Phycisphaerales bacterium]
MGNAILNKAIIRQIFAVTAGAGVGGCVFMPVFTVIFSLAADLIPEESGLPGLLASYGLDALAICLSGFLMGILVSLIATSKQLAMTIVSIVIVVTIYGVQIAMHGKGMSESLLDDTRLLAIKFAMMLTLQWIFMVIIMAVSAILGARAAIRKK